VVSSQFTSLLSIRRHTIQDTGSVVKSPPKYLTIVLVYKSPFRYNGPEHNGIESGRVQLRTLLDFETLETFVWRKRGGGGTRKPSARTASVQDESQTGHLLNDKLEEMLNKVGVAYLRHYPGISMEGMGQEIKNLSPGQDSNQAPPE
jgi:hypothetical protein